MKLTARGFDGKRHELTVSPDDTVDSMKLKLQRLTGAHKASQRLVFAGSTLKDTDLVKDTALSDGATVFVMELKTFPATLGPFVTPPVPFAARDFELPPLDGESFSREGAMWQMQKRALTRQSVRATAGAEFPLCGQFSPPHPVTLTAEEKRAIGIPQEAASFVWSYPVAEWGSLDGGSDAARSFLQAGGFVYLSDAQAILHATTVTPSDSDEGGLQFGRYASWRAEWTQALMKHGRFQRITIRALNDLGAHHFCWLRPGETLCAADGTPFAQQPQVPHGGFAYLFHDDVFSSDAEAVQLDRYFACTSGDEYVAPIEVGDGGGGMTSRAFAATFELVSELQAIHDDMDAAAATAAAAATTTPATSSPSSSSSSGGVMQQRINQLQQQLDAATRCVACLVVDKDTILNCGHVCMCRACAQRVSACPICRVRITERKRAFAS